MGSGVGVNVGSGVGVMVGSGVELGVGVLLGSGVGVGVGEVVGVGVGSGVLVIFTLRLHESVGAPEFSEVNQVRSIGLSSPALIVILSDIEPPAVMVLPEKTKYPVLSSSVQPASCTVGEEMVKTEE